MDTQRLFLLLIFSLSLFLLWDNWQRAQQHPVPPLTTTAVPAVSAPATIAPDANVVAEQKEILPPGQRIKVQTDSLLAEISTNGGNLSNLKLTKQRDAKDKSKPFELFQQQEGHTYIAQTGLLGDGLPTHNSVFEAAKSEYKLADDSDSLEVRLVAANLATARVTKIYTFHRGSHLIDVSYEIENRGSAPIAPTAYFQLVRDKAPPADSSKFVPTYTGPAVYTEKEKFQKVSFSDIEKGKIKYPQKTDNGWIGMLQHYFVAAWLPEGGTQREYYTKQLGENLFSAGVILPATTIAPGKSVKISVPLYAGPARVSLNKIAPGLGLTVDYGWLTIIATPLFWVLSFLHEWVHNWGVAIILLTVLIKLIFFPLSATSYRSMGKMRVVAPKLEKIKQQYGDDRERLHKAMMELYKTEKINPLGGCLPMLIQIPVFISLYWVILSSVELRHAPFFGWIEDLSAADPYYVLPLIMGTSMIIQSRLSPPPPDPLQAKVMRIMPIAFSVVFFFFPAGLVLYSTVNNLLSIAQQWYITRSIEALSQGAGKT
jgi:YidC/Oxa1 family membrane protein insertase